MFLLVLYSVIMVPMQAAFESAFHPALAWNSCNVLVDSAFILDMGINFRTSFMRNGALIKESRSIVQYYLHGEFRLDSIVAFPYVWVLQPAFNSADLPVAARLIPLSRLLRTLVRLYRVESNGGLLKTSSMLRFNPGLVRVGQLMLMLLLACHWTGCLWWLIGEIDIEGRELAIADPESNTWPASEWLQRQEFILRYAQSLLWGTGLMTTILPYDVVPRTITQTFVTIVVVSIGLLINVLFISATTTALQNMDAKFSAGRQKVEAISKYLLFKKVPTKLTTKIVDYYEYQNFVADQSVQLADLPHELSMELNIELYSSLIKNCPLFRLLDTSQVLHLLREMYVKVLMPSDIVVAEGQPSDALYFISRGLLRVWKDFENLTNARRLLVTLEENDFFGENAILGDGVANATIECFSFCEVLVLTRKSFQSVLAASDAKQESTNRSSARDDNRTMVQMLQAASVAVKAQAASRKEQRTQRAQRSSSGAGSFCRRSGSERDAKVLPVGMEEVEQEQARRKSKTELLRRKSSVAHKNVGGSLGSPDSSFNKRKLSRFSITPVPRSKAKSLDVGLLQNGGMIEKAQVPFDADAPHRARCTTSPTASGSPAPA